MKKNPLAVAWLDADDALIEFSAPFNVKYGLPASYVPDSRGYGPWDIGKPMETALAELSGEFVATQPPIAGAVALTNWLKRQGIPVIILTAIPARDAPERLINLVNNGFHFDQIYFTKGRKKHDFAKALLKKISPAGETCSIFMDDMAPAVFEFVKNVPKAFGLTLNIPFTADSFKNHENVDLVNNGVVTICKDSPEMVQSFRRVLKDIRDGQE